MKRIFVLCGIDSHLPRVENCLKSIKFIYKDSIDIGISTFGNRKQPPSKKLKEYSENMGFIFYDCPRQKFSPLNREFHCCEILGMLSMFKYYYSLGYDEVYLLHNDMFIFRDFLPRYAKNMKNNWCFITPFVNIDPPPMKFEDVIKYSNMKIKDLPSRLSQTVVIFNPKFINDIYNRYKTEEIMWNEIFKKLDMHGDVGLFYLAKGFMEYKGNPIVEEIQTSLRFFKGNMVNEIIRNRNICIAHNPDTYKLLKDKFENILKKIYN